jgi:hypothetical protein
VRIVRLGQEKSKDFKNRFSAGDPEVETKQFGLMSIWNNEPDSYAPAKKSLRHFFTPVAVLLDQINTLTKPTTYAAATLVTPPLSGLSWKPTATYTNAAFPPLPGHTTG